MSIDSTETSRQFSERKLHVHDMATEEVFEFPMPDGLYGLALVARDRKDAEGLAQLEEINKLDEFMRQRRIER